SQSIANSTAYLQTKAKLTVTYEKIVILYNKLRSSLPYLNKAKSKATLTLKTFKQMGGLVSQETITKLKEYKSNTLTSVTNSQ
ncbi:hypothetical protein U2071_15770, partial [Listeria monocytogenes]|uniref:hypothetical protein n=1 Tax=Listeria monocytogenes TaxID=1639 RepID=UPI002FDC5C95